MFNADYLVSEQIGVITTDQTLQPCSCVRDCKQVSGWIERSVQWKPEDNKAGVLHGNLMEKNNQQTTAAFKFVTSFSGFETLAC